MINKIAVIGHTGMVGSQVYDYYKKLKLKPLGFSKDIKNGDKNNTWDEINEKCEIIFICVPTPFDFAKSKSNFKIVEEVIEKITPGKIVVIKSTIHPGFTEYIQSKFPKIKILFNPEFLSRTTAKKDFLKPDRQLVGYTKKSMDVAQKILDILPSSPYSKLMKSSEAELVKYAHNVFGAIRITFANHLYEASQKLKVDYDEVKNGFVASNLVGEINLRYMTIFHNGKRGFGGPCFPKDINSYLEFCKKNKIKSELITGARDANKRILKSQGISEKESERY